MKAVLLKLCGTGWGEGLEHLSDVVEGDQKSEQPLETACDCLTECF